MCQASADTGGDSGAVQEQRTNVQQIQASFSAFAAIRGDGSVVTWGDAASGGDSCAVLDQLQNSICSRSKPPTAFLPPCFWGWIGRDLG